MANNDSKNREEPSKSVEILVLTLKMVTMIKVYVIE